MTAADLLTILGSVALIVGLGIVHIGLGLSAMGIFMLLIARSLSGEDA
jgi:hypothetical protein